MKVTIRKDRVIECDGKPFFPLQARHLPIGASIKDVADAGFNCIRYLVFGGLNMGSQAIPHNLQGMKLCAYLYDRTHLKHEKSLTNAVEMLRARTDLLSYENFNEPAWRPDTPMVVNAAASDLAPGYRLLKQLDPDHPVHQGHSCSGTVEALREYNPCSDIIGCNPYPVLPAKMRQHIGIRPDGRALDSPDQTISAVTDYTSKMVAVGEGRKPVWMQLQAMAWEDFYGPLTKEGPRHPDPASILYPTYEQLRYMAFAEIISGATGLLFSMYNVPTDQAIWRDIKKLVRELSELHDVLAGRTVDVNLQTQYKNLGFSIWKGVTVLAKEVDGRRFLLAANNSPDPAEVTWSGLKDGKALRVAGENRRLKVVRGEAVDRFESYAVHVYELGDGVSA